MITELNREILRLSSLGLVEHSADRRQAIHHKHVEAFSEQLRPMIERALKEEADFVAKEWFEQAEKIALWLIGPDAVEASSVSPVSGVGLPPISSGADSSSPSRLLSTSARESIHVRVSESLRRGANEVTQDEIEEHSIELAQLLLSNWIGVLEQALHDAPTREPIALEFKALPPQAEPSLLSRGCEAFSLPVEDCIKALLAYQDCLAGSDEAAELSASIKLHRAVDGRWRVLRSDSEDELWQVIPAIETHTENSAEAAYLRISYDMADHLVSRIVSMGSEPDIDAQTVKKLVFEVANHAVKERQRCARMACMKSENKFSAESLRNKNISKGARLAKNVCEMVRVEWGERASPRRAGGVKVPDVLRVLGNLNPANLYFVSLPATELVEWMYMQDVTVLGAERYKPNGSGEKWVLESTKAIVADIVNMNPTHDTRLRSSQDVYHSDLNCGGSSQLSHGMT